MYTVRKVYAAFNLKLHMLIEVLGLQEGDLKTTCFKWLRAVGPGEFTGPFLKKEGVREFDVCSAQLPAVLF